MGEYFLRKKITLRYIEMALKDMRSELRELRKAAGSKPISKMRKDDISREIERLKVSREETPAVASVPSAPLKKSVSAVESVKEAKKMEFPVAPESMKKSSKKPTMAAGRGAVNAGEKKKMEEKPMMGKVSKKDKLMKLMAMLESDEE